MRSTSLLALSVGLVALAIVVTAGALPAAAESVEEIVTRANHASYYQGADGRATVTMTITNRNQNKRVRQFTILRKNLNKAKDADQTYYVYFHKPADVARTVFLVHKHTDKDDDRWLYMPGLDLVKRIAASDKRTSFVGSDFMYEDVSGRGLDQDRHELVKTTSNYFVIKNTPKDSSTVEFASYEMYIHRSTYLPTKVTFLNASGKAYRIMTVDAVKKIQGFPTVTKATMQDLDSGSKTVVEYTDVAYDTGVPERIFTERYLRRPPVKYLQ